MNNIFKILILILFIIILSKESSKIQNVNKKDKNMLNLYNKKIEECGTKSMSNGSWDKNRQCSELDGGVHQICIKDISNNTDEFSLNTGQTDWSENRKDNNHCVCLGAWSLYVAKKKRQGKNIDKNILKCEAIPKISLSEKYISKFSEGWNKWNGLEINEQVKHGVEELFKNCYKGNDKDIFLENYCNFAKKVELLKKSKLFLDNCKYI